MKRNFKTIGSKFLTAMALCISLTGCSVMNQVSGDGAITTQAKQETQAQQGTAKTPGTPETPVPPGTPETPGSKKPDPLMQDGNRMIFVGNSHTYVNDLPGLFHALTAAAGHTIDVYECSEGAYYLKMFADSEDEMGSVLVEALENESWDFVILQENTNGAISADKEMKEPVRKLDTLIKGAGGQTVLLMTWAPKDGASFFSHQKVQDMIAEGYYSIASDLDAPLIPGGIAFTAAMEEVPEIELWGDDGQHASPAGTYLAACTTYAVLLQETPVGIPFYGEVTEAEAQKLQQIAADLVLGKR